MTVPAGAFTTVLTCPVGHKLETVCGAIQSNSADSGQVAGFVLKSTTGVLQFVAPSTDVVLGAYKPLVFQHVLYPGDELLAYVSHGLAGIGFIALTYIDVDYSD